MKRRLYYLVMMMLTLTATPLLTTSCEETPQTEVVDPNTDPNENLEPSSSPFRLEQIGESAFDYSVEISYNSSEVPSQYMVALISDEEYAAMGASAAAFADSAIAAAKKAEVDFTDIDNKYIFNKPTTVDIAGTWEVEPSGKYAFLVVGVNNNGEITAEPAVKVSELSDRQPSPFRLEARGTSEYDYSVMIGYNSDELSSQYMVSLITAEEYEAEMQSKVRVYAESVIAKAKEDGVNFAEIDSKYIFDKPATVDCSATWDVEQDQTYAFLVVGVNNYGEMTAEPKVLVTELSGEKPTPFDVKVVGKSANSISIEVDPVSGLGNYYVGVVTLDEYKTTYSSDAQELAEYFVFDEFPGMDYNTVDNERIFEGHQTIALKNGWSFLSNTEYAICVYGVEGDVEYDGEDELILNSVMTTAPVVVTGKTSEASDSPFQIAITGATYEDIFYEVTTTFDGIYYTGGCSKSSFETYYGSNIEKAAQSVLDTEEQYYIDWEDTTGNSIYQGNSGEVNYGDSWMTTPDTEYIIFAVGVDKKGSMTTGIGYTEAKTLPLEKSDMTINISVSDISAYSATITFTPSERKYYLFQVMSKEMFDSFKSDEELQDYLMYQIFEEDNSDRMYTEVEEKSVTYNGLFPDQTYVALAFGFYYYTQEPLTEVFSYEFSTAPLEDPGIQFPSLEDIELSNKEFGEFEISNVESQEITFNATPADPDLTYLVMITKKELYDTYKSDKELLRDDFDWIEYTAKDMQNKVIDEVGYLSYTGALEDELISGLPGGTEFAVYAYGISLETLQPTTKIATAFCTTKGSSSSYDDYGFDYVAPKMLARPAAKTEVRAIEYVNPLAKWARWM